MIKGIAASGGVGVGAVFVLHEREVPIGRASQSSPGSGANSGSAPHRARSADSELERFRKGRAVAADYYRSLMKRVEVTVGAEEAEIFEGHLEILTGDDLSEAVEDAIWNNGATAEEAVTTFAEETAVEFEELDSEYFQQRAGDIRDIGHRVAEAIYYGSITDPGALPEDSVVVAEELTPSGTARLDTSRVVAIATEKGGRTSHAAILARSLSIPCVTGVSGLIEQVRSGQRIVVDGDTGLVDLEPDEEALDEIIERRAAEEKARQKREEWSRTTPAQLSDGETIHLSANVGGAAEAELARNVGAEGSGLFRSEFVFMRFSDYPTAAQQAAEYRKVCEILSPSPVIVRLLDCGADKPLPYARHTPEDNPFLGERGIRFLMARREQFEAQVEAICTVAAEGYPIKLMIPMVINESEIDAVREVAEDALQRLGGNTKLPIGIMVETPASVLRINALARKADFVSLGTNDLVQYLLAVDRGNAQVAPLYEEFNPAVVTAISRVAEVCHQEGVHVGVCGDMASHAATALALLALGVDELSAAGTAIPELKSVFAAVSREELRELREALENAESGAQGRAAAERLVNKG